jgi:hypothetical protein
MKSTGWRDMSQVELTSFNGTSVTFIWCVYHVHHADQLRHRDRIGRVRFGKRDNVKSIGIFTSGDKAQAAVETVRDQPGFIDEPNCFSIVRLPTDTDFWPQGFRATLRRSETSSSG